MRLILLLDIYIFVRCYAEDRPGEDVQRTEFANWHHSRALSFASTNQYEESLGHFRAACRAKPTIATYWSDLGVTEMRLGMYPRAARRFVRALALEPSFHIAKDNLEELRRFMKPDDFSSAVDDKTDRRQLQHLDKPTEVSIKRLAKMTLDKDEDVPDAMLSKPFIIRKALQQLGWNLTELSPERVAELYGENRADFYPHNMHEENVRPIFESLQKSISQLTWPQAAYDKRIDASEQGTYIQWNLDADTYDSLMLHAHATLPPLLDDSHWAKKCLPTSSLQNKFNLYTHWKMLLIGENGSGMFNHKDSLQTSSWQVQISGRKKWHICSPSQDQYLYRAGDVDTFEPDNDRFPLFRNASCVQFTLNSGDLVFYPRGWWHQTMNLITPTVSLTGTLITAQCYKEVVEEFRLQCAGKGTIFGSDKELCDAFEVCASIFAGVYEQRPYDGDDESSGGGITDGSGGWAAVQTNDYTTMKVKDDGHTLLINKDEF